MTSNLDTPALGVPLTGTVKLWRRQGGFGFVCVDGYAAEVFCPRRALPDGLRHLDPGQRVRFVLALDRTDRVAATDVAVIDSEAAARA